MNSEARLRGQPAKQFGMAAPTCDGRLAMQLVERTFWQSRATCKGAAAAPFEVVNLFQLSKDIRHAFRK